MTHVLGNPFLQYELRVLNPQNSALKGCAETILALQEDTNLMQRATLYAVLQTALDRVADPLNDAVFNKNKGAGYQRTSLGRQFFNFAAVPGGTIDQSDVFMERALAAMSLDQCWYLAPEDIPSSTTLAQEPEALQAALVRSPALRRVVLAAAYETSRGSPFLISGVDGEATNRQRMQVLVDTLGTLHPVFKLIEELQGCVKVSLLLPFLVTRASPVVWAQRHEPKKTDGPFVYWNLLRRTVGREHICPGVTAFETDGYVSAMSAAYGQVEADMRSYLTPDSYARMASENVKVSYRSGRKQKSPRALATSVKVTTPARQAMPDEQNAYPHADRDVSVMLLPAKTMGVEWTMTRRHDGSAIAETSPVRLWCKEVMREGEPVLMPQLPHSMLAALAVATYAQEDHAHSSSHDLWQELGVVEAQTFPHIIPDAARRKSGAKPTAPVDLALGETWGWIAGAIQTVALMRRFRVFRFLEQNENRLHVLLKPLQDAMRRDGWSPQTPDVSCTMFSSRLKTMLMHTASHELENYSGVTSEEDRKKKTGRPNKAATTTARSGFLTHEQGAPGLVMPEALLVSPYAASPVPSITGGVPTDTEAEVAWTAALLLRMVEHRLQHLTEDQRHVLDAAVKSRSKYARVMAENSEAQYTGGHLLDVARTLLQTNEEASLRTGAVKDWLVEAIRVMGGVITHQPHARHVVADVMTRLHRIAYDPADKKVAPGRKQAGSSPAVYKPVTPGGMYVPRTMSKIEAGIAACLTPTVRDYMVHKAMGQKEKYPDD